MGAVIFGPLLFEIQKSVNKRRKGKLSLQLAAAGRGIRGIAASRQKNRALPWLCRRGDYLAELLGQLHLW